MWVVPLPPGEHRSPRSFHGSPGDPDQQVREQRRRQESGVAAAGADQLARRASFSAAGVPGSAV
jgi:hypothetical protein